MKNLKYAQDLIKASSSVNCGFNSFINGHSQPKRSDYGCVSEWGLITQGYDFARKMAEDNGIAFTHVFKCKQDGCFPFQYGGFFVCNACGNKDVNKEWWKIQVEKDGNEFCCHGLDFENLQESNNYAFGETFEQAIINYGILMRNLN
jgi:hypothetical protein